MTDHERLLQAIQNVAEIFGGASKVLLLAIIKEEKRLKKWEESQRQKEQTRRFNEASKEKKITGQWPDWYNKEDDIPF